MVRSERWLTFEQLETRQLLAVTLDVGEIRLLPDTSEQIVELYAFSSDPIADPLVSGFNLRAQLGDGLGGAPEPVFESVDFDVGIWEAFPRLTTGDVPVLGAPQFAQASVAFHQSGAAVAPDGLVARLAISTVGFAGGQFELMLAGSQIGLPSDFIQAGSTTFAPTIINGIIIIGAANQSPSAVDDTGVTDEDTVLELGPPGVLGNDVDLDSGDILSVVSADSVSAWGATIAVADDGGFVYDPTVSPALQALEAGQTVDDTFEYTITDGNGGFDSATVTVTVTGLLDKPNEAPVNSLPTPQNTHENTALFFSSAGGNPINISDNDAGTAGVQVTLSAAHGTVSLAGTEGLVFTEGDGLADATMSLSGTLAAINAALDGLRFDPAPNFSGWASLEVMTNDLGHSGSGGPLTDTDTLPIDVRSVEGGGPNDNATTAHSLKVDSRLEGDIDHRDDVDFFEIRIEASAHLTASVDSLNQSTLDPVLALYSEEGRLLVVSDDHTRHETGARIEQHVGPGTYLLKVSASKTGAEHEGGVYLLSTQTSLSTPPLAPLPVGRFPVSIVAADFNLDGHLDLATVNGGFGGSQDVSLMLGIGNGSFGPETRIAVGGNPFTLVAADLNRDGPPDLIVTDMTSGEYVILQGRGDGSFLAARRIEIGGSLVSTVVADFNGDGWLDLASTDAASNQLAILLGSAAGSFQQALRPNVGQFPISLISTDLNGDGVTDLATVNTHSADASILLGNGDGTFRSETRVAVGENPYSLAQADFDRDGRTDLVAVLADSDEFVILRGAGDGTFQREYVAQVGDRPLDVLAADFTGDGRPDVVTLHRGTDDVAVSQGRGDGTFFQPQFCQVGDGPIAGATGDFNEDGRWDVVVVNEFSGDVSVRLGKGDGTFEHEPALTVGREPAAIVAADFNADGRFDLAVANERSDSVSIALGVGDGTFDQERRIPVGSRPVALAAADLNADGRPDLVTANRGSNDLTIRMGLGDGSFREAVYLAAGDAPSAVMVVDLNADGQLDLVATNEDSDDISIWLGGREGVFSKETRLHVGGRPTALDSGDFNGDGKLDLAVVSRGDNRVAILLGRGNGGFQPASMVAVGVEPMAVVARDFNGDGRPDLAVANTGFNEVDESRLFPGSLWVLTGRGDGTFGKGPTFSLGNAPSSLVAADLNADGLPDLAASNEFSRDVFILIALAGGGFQAEDRPAVGLDPLSVVSADFNGDGNADLATADQLADSVSILAGLGDGTFVDVGDVVSGGVLSVPLVYDLDGDGIRDLTVLSRDGEILFRQGRAQEFGTFAPPVIVNPGFPARDVTVAVAPTGAYLAAIDRTGGSISRYFVSGDSQFRHVAGPTTSGGLPSRIKSADLDGNGRGDLVLANAAESSVSVYLADGDGAYRPELRFSAGNGAAALELADVDRDGNTDILATNQISGDVTLLQNDGRGGFQQGQFRADGGLYGMGIDLLDRLAIESRARTSGLAAGDFDGDGWLDLILANPGVNSVSLLLGKAGGSFVDPLVYQTEHVPTAVAVGDLNNDEQLDFVFLGEGDVGICVYLGDGRGGFSAAAGEPIAAGSAPTGVSVHDIDGDGVLDLLVGNEYGDALTVTGNGDGTFQSYRRVGQRIAIATADFDGDGYQDVVLSNEGLDRVSVQLGGGERTFQPGFQSDADDELIAPGSVEVADVNRDNHLDIVAVNRGGNSLLVYVGSEGGRFSTPRRFYTGTNPASVTLADVNADGRLDAVVPNEGSNDVSVLLGQGDREQWTFTPGSRLDLRLEAASGAEPVFGLGPVAADVVDRNDDGIPDLLVTNSNSNNAFLISGIGNGFYDDRNPIVYDTGSSPSDLLVGQFDQSPGLDFIVINSGSDNLTFYSNFDTTRRFDIFTGGNQPTVGLYSDLNSDGALDLIVSHYGDGTVSLFLAAANGMDLAYSFLDASLTHPTAMALAELGDGQGLSLLVMDEGDELVHVFGADELLPPVEPPPIPESLLSTGILLATRSPGNLPFFGQARLGILGTTFLQILALFTDSTTPAGGSGDGSGGGEWTIRNLVDDFREFVSWTHGRFEHTVELAERRLGRLLGTELDADPFLQFGKAASNLVVPRLPFGVLSSLGPVLRGAVDRLANPQPEIIDTVMADDDRCTSLSEVGDSGAADVGELSADEADAAYAVMELQFESQIQLEHLVPVLAANLVESSIAGDENVFFIETSQGREIEQSCVVTGTSDQQVFGLETADAPSRQHEAEVKQVPGERADLYRHVWKSSIAAISGLLAVCSYLVRPRRDIVPSKIAADGTN